MTRSVIVLTDLALPPIYRLAKESVKMSKLWIFVVLLCAIGITTAANPLKNPSNCGRPVCNPGTKFKYQQEYRYQYKYSVDVNTLFAGSSKNESSMHIDATVTLDFISPCEGILQVDSLSLAEKAPIYDREEDIDIISPDLPNAEDFDRDISRYKLRFSFQDGAISEVCPHVKESTWVLNFKRGILSAFHNTMKRFDVDHNSIESDVNGDCDTTYSLLGARETSLALLKKKDISTCTSRYKHHSVLQMTPYVFPASFKTTPIMKSSSECEIIIDHNIYSKVICNDRHLFQPFSNKESGAMTTTRQMLTLIVETNTTLAEEEPISRRASLIFDHDATPKPTSGELKASRDLVKTMCKLNDDDVKQEFPDTFTKFIHTARLLSYPALTQIVERSGALCTTGKKHVYDALPLLGSNAAITVMKDIIFKDDVPLQTVHEWLMALAFIPRPDLTTITIITPLLFHEKADSQFLLSISSVVHTYCKYANVNCALQEEVLNIANIIEDQIISGCKAKKSDRKTQEKTQVAMKAVGNMGIPTKTLTRSLSNCILDEELPMALRIAAVEAHRRLPCEESRDYFLELFRNQTFDSELRTASYLKVMRCPNYLTVMTIQHALKEEEVNQVGSFVWSHLANLLSTSIPSRIEIQGLLQDKDLVRKFSSDVRKFSRNYEGSMFLDEYNIGGNAESNIIFSTKSYIPRTAMMNLTVDLFGESINVFEVAGRFEGFEHYVEKIFGPNGPYKSLNRIADKFVKTYRFARSITDNIQEKVDELPYIVENNFRNPKATLGFKIFGNELNYKSFEGDNEIQATLAALNPFDRLKQLLQGQELNLQKSALFMDTSYIIPTSTGLPITLSAVGTAAINLKISGKLVAPDFLATKALDLEGKLRPSVSMDVVGTMGVDAYYASTGLKLKTNLYSSAAVDGQLKIRGSKLVSVTFSLPKDKTEIVSARSELVVMRGEIEEFQNGITENRVEKNMCSWPSLDRTLGLNLCADFQFPNATSDLNAPQPILCGPTKFGISLNKADPTAKQYVLEYKWETTETTTYIGLVFDTPGSNLKRELSAKLNLDRQNKNLTLHLRSPESNFLAHGTYKNEPDEKYINFGLELNGKRHLDAQIGLKSRAGKYGFTHYPRLYIAINNDRIAELSGNLKWVDKNQIAQCDVNLEFRTKKLTTKLFGYIRRSNASISFDVKLDYEFDTKKMESVRVQASYANRNENQKKTAEGKLILESTAYPQFNFESSLNYQGAPGHVDCKIEINTKPHLHDDRYKLTLQLMFLYFSNQDGKKMSASIQVTKPIADIDLKFGFTFHTDGIKSNFNSEIQYATNKKLVLTIEVKMPKTVKFQLDGKLELSVPSFSPMSVWVSISEKETRDYDIGFSATWFSGHSLVAKGVFQDKTSLKAQIYNLKLSVRSPSFEEVTLNCKLLKDNREVRVDLQAEYLSEKYALLLKHSAHSPSEFDNRIEVKYKNRLYSLLSEVSLQEPRRILLELHLDEYRDIHLLLRGTNKNSKKEVAFDIKWDANRDPGQKFAASIGFDHPGYLNYSGGFMVSFPGRTVKGAFIFDLKSTILDSSVHLEWSPHDAIDVKLLTFYDYSQNIVFEINSELLTPFENWKRTSLAGGFRHEGNLVRANGSVYWQDDQHVALDIFGDYLVDDPDFRFEFNASIVSTIPQVSSVSGSFYHKHNRTNYVTNALLQNNPADRISVHSYWTLNEGALWSNLTGTIQMTSPFIGYQKGILRSQIRISKENDVQGVSDLELEKKKYTLSLDGKLKKLTNSMVEFNITTPIQKYHTINGRFGYSEPKKHLVALLKGPSSAIGIEILFRIVTSAEFEVKFHVATPIEVLEKILLVGKLNSNAADFRCGYNNLTLGFTGVWQYENPTDFEYSCIIYTPLPTFEENGVIAKLIQKEKHTLDFEASIKLADIMLGVKVQGEPKPQVLAGVHIPKKSSSEDEEEDEEDGEENEISWRGMVEINLIVYPAVTGSLDIDQKDSLYIIHSSLNIPNGTIEIHDEFIFEDVLTMNNKLQLTTPFVTFSELTSNYVFEVMFGEKYIVGLDGNYCSFNNWTNSGVLVNYTYEVTEDEEMETHSAIFNLYTPFKMLKSLEGKVLVEKEDHFYRSNVTVATTQSSATVSANLEYEKDFFEASVGFGMDVPLLKVPMFKVTARKDFSKSEKELALTLEKFNPNKIVYGIEGSLHYEKNLLFKTKMNLNTPFESLPSLTGMISYARIAKESSYSFDALVLFAAKQEFHLGALLKPNQISLSMETPLESFRKLVINGTMRGPDSKHRTLIGTVVYDDRTYDVAGEVAMSNEIPMRMKIATPFKAGKIIMAEFLLQKEDEGYRIETKFNAGDDKLELAGVVKMRASFDWNANLMVATTHPEYKLFTFNGKYLRMHDGNLTFDFNTATSIVGLERLRLSANSLLTQNTGKVRSSFDITKARGNFQGEWVWILMENMGVKLTGDYDAGEQTKQIASELFYRNPKKSFKHVALGLDANYNKNEWQFGVNGTLDLPQADDISLLLNLKTPPPNHDIHTVVGKFQYTKDYAHVLQILKYFTAYSKDTSYGTSGELSQNKEAIKANLQLDWGGENKKTINNILDVKRKNKQIDLLFTLRTPKFEEETLVAKMFYDNVNDIHKARGDIYSPAERYITGGMIDFEAFANMNGSVNTTTPFPTIPYLGTNFITISEPLLNKRYLEIFWPNQNAFLNSTYVYDSKDFNTQLNGSVVVELPLTKRHVGKIIYGYKEAALHKTGYSFVEYNNKQFLEGKYNCDSESSAGFEKDTINIQIENQLHPVGIKYIRQYEYSGGSNGLNLPTKATKKAEIFKLRNKDKFHLSGEMAVETTFTGQDIAVVAIHSNRTVRFETKYDFLDQQFNSKSFLSLDPDAWASYDLKILNKTTTEKEEDHVELNFAYPKRKFTLSGYYQLTNNSLSSEMTFNWNKEAMKKKTMGASFDWKQITVVPNKQHAVVALKHPSFSRDVTLNTHYFGDSKTLFDVTADLEYSSDANKTLSLAGKLQDTSLRGVKRYNAEIMSRHPATKLNLKVNGQVRLAPSVYETNSSAEYKRSYLPQQYGHAHAKLDLIQKEIDLEKSSLRQKSYLRGKYYGKYPNYLINGSIAKGSELNSTGYFLLDLDNYLVQAQVNLTPDAQECFHTYGKIPDSRNAVFNVWRVYEDVSVSDVSFYWRLNHSRLVTSKLIWRPELEEEIKTGVQDTIDSTVDIFYETIEYWKQYIKSETMDAVNDIWLDAKYVMQNFLEDVRELKTLEEDVEEFKVFLNTSYNANEFYIKDIVNITSYLIDELAIRGHIEAFPDILNEFWGVMGGTGAAIRSSLVWIIEKIKTSYKNAKEFINSVLRGDMMDHVTKLVDNMIEKYDKFVKDLHVKFITHIENLWHKFTELIQVNWNNFLIAVEPTFIEFAHYVETIVWKVSKEVIDFLYERQNELVESPYYTKLANFTQDVDRLYKDIKKNDAITNIKKYSIICYEFVKERYFSIVPFGKELQNIVVEIIEEFKQLLVLPTINYFITKANELYTKVEYLYNYFDIGTKTQRFVQFVHQKITEISKTALQAEDTYREAKTKFIFNPEEGRVELEQKLPMSWHAFNETPKFEEIPEYKAINDIQNYFIVSNTTFWTLYYQYKPYSEPSNWLPPFTAQAIMAGPQHYYTFDKSFFEYRGTCTYLLARDFVDGNFSLAVAYDHSNKKEVHEIALLIDERTIIIDLFHDSLKILGVGTTKLPAQFGDTFIYQDAQMVSIENSQGFTMSCNLKYDVCTYTLSGWYFGKTAGLLGTMDNEPSSDFMTSRNVIDKDIGRFAHSWALEPQKCSSIKNYAVELQKYDFEIYEKCEALFKSKVSQFSHCFAVVDPTPFMKMCLNSRIINEYEACTAAIAYMQACSIENTPLRIPDTCVTCKLINGTEYPEGQFVELTNSSVPQSTDVVFLVEAKDCNKDIMTKRSIPLLIAALAKELSDAKIRSNRFAVVVFGGDGVINEPRSVVVDNNIFTNQQSVVKYFEDIPIGNGNADIFGAIGYAAKLSFRPGVSKTFIILPCTNCDPSNMTLDYTVMHQVLVENDITLHILMNDDFIFEKYRERKAFYGMDGQTAYTKKDTKILQGDEDLRRQVKLPKSMLGFCIPLALETKGTVFTAKKLENDGKRVNAAKKFSTVFGKRIAKSAVPYECQNCECTADNNGMSYMECFPCDHLVAASLNIDYGFSDSEFLDIDGSELDSHAEDDLSDR